MLNLARVLGELGFTGSFFLLVLALASIVLVLAFNYNFANCSLLFYFSLVLKFQFQLFQYSIHTAFSQKMIFYKSWWIFIVFVWENLVDAAVVSPGGAAGPSADSIQTSSGCLNN